MDGFSLEITLLGDANKSPVTTLARRGQGESEFKNGLYSMENLKVTKGGKNERGREGRRKEGEGERRERETSTKDDPQNNNSYKKQVTGKTPLRTVLTTSLLYSGLFIFSLPSEVTHLTIILV